MKKSRNRLARALIPALRTRSLLSCADDEKHCFRSRWLELHKTRTGADGNRTPENACFGHNNNDFPRLNVSINVLFVNALLKFLVQLRTFVNKRRRVIRIVAPKHWDQFAEDEHRDYED